MSPCWYSGSRLTRVRSQMLEDRRGFDIAATYIRVAVCLDPPPMA